jgi:hypothetical protein
VPLARYFITVGGTLAALLFIASWCLPTPPALFAEGMAIDRTTIRIRSARKWPEKIVLDTSQPTITPPAIEQPLAMELPLEEARNRSNLEAMAQIAQSPAVVDRTLQIKRDLPKGARSRRVARGPAKNRRAETGLRCCQFGWIDRGRTMSNAALQERAALSWPFN